MVFLKAGHRLSFIYAFIIHHPEFLIQNFQYA